MKGTIKFNKIWGENNAIYEFSIHDINNYKKGEDLNEKKVNFEPIEKSKKKAINIELIFEAKSKASPRSKKQEQSINKSKNIMGEEEDLLCLPKDTRMALDKDKIQNYALWYNRIIRYNSSYEIIHDFYNKNKEKALEMIESRSILNKITSRQMELASKAFGKEAYQKIKYRPYAKLLIGIGGDNPFGNIPSITLHHIYGIPYIPASTLKGITRSFYIYKKHDGEEKSALMDERFIEWFGSSEGEGQKGSIVFLDAFPSKAPIIEFEPISPHYASYYTSAGEKSPTDYDKVIPLYVPAIVNTEFEIYFGDYDMLEKKSLEQFKTYVVGAVEWLGIGAKTSSGYGIGETK